MKFVSKALLAASLVLAPLPVLADTFVLVHGAFQSASGWQQVSDSLTSQGHTVIAVDLPGRDAQGEAAKQITLDAYIDEIADAVAGAGEPVVLVGHSFAGMTITAVADRVPEQIKKLIYVAAYVPENGESMEKLAISDTDNGFTQKTFVIAKDYSHAVLLAEDQVRVFAQDATAMEAEQLVASMIREPLGPIGTPVALSNEGGSKVSKAYVRTLNDATVSPTLQSWMIDRAGITDVVDVDSGHAPYLTAVDELTAALVTLAD
jgi:pimeloyl-ACP methyl ester carboxylesterase